MQANDDRDRAAIELYDRRRRHGAGCAGWLTLADELTGRCSACGAPVLAGPLDPEQAAAMLADLRARRVALGLGDGA